MTELSVSVDRFKIAGSFAISRGRRTESVVVSVTLRDGDALGRAECVPYARYGESTDSVTAQIEAQRTAIANGRAAEAIASMPAGAARNALDCAHWDLRAKQQGEPVWTLAGLPKPKPVTTCYTISLDTPEAMHEAAARAAHRSLLKIKLGSDGDPERIHAIRQAAPDSTLVIDANEGWTEATLANNISACEAANVQLIEQPLPSGQDAALAAVRTKTLICADESMHDLASLNALPDWYSAVNIKLDKTGGLTEAIATARAAQSRGLSIMVGCMLGSSLGMAPAMMIAEFANYVDLDGPLLLAEDREPALQYEGSLVYPPEHSLWG